jgi:hypothetical protein
MAAIENEKIYGLKIRESANDGSDFTNPDVDYRVAFLGEDGLWHVKDSAGAVTNPYSGGGTTSNFPCQGRLTLTTAVPVTTADVTAATSVYFTPYQGNQIATYSGSAWTLSTFTEKTLSLAGLTADSNYDIFIVDSTLALEALIWTNATTRATALVLQDGILVKSGATTRRYLGTIRITGTTGQCEDSAAKRFVWNYYNRRLRFMKVTDATDTWNQTVTAWRQANASTANQVAYVDGYSEDVIRATTLGAHGGGSGIAGAVGVGVDSTTANSAQIFNEANSSTTTNPSSIAHYRGYPGVGYHTLVWIEYRRAGTVVWQGDAGVVDEQTGLIAEVWG